MHVCVGTYLSVQYIIMVLEFQTFGNLLPSPPCTSKSVVAEETGLSDSLALVYICTYTELGFAHLPY